MIKHFFIVLLLLNPVMQSSSQHRFGCKQIALSHSDVALTSNPFAQFYNPAALAQDNNLELNLFYSPAPFGVKELFTSGCAFSKNINYGTIGAAYTTFGYELFREQKIAISYANTINQIFSIGISAIYHNVSIKNYGTDYTFVFIVGGIYEIEHNIKIAFSIYNPNKATYGNENDQLPIIFNFGAAYKFAEYATLCFTNSKELNEKNAIRLGFIFSPVNWTEFQIGYTNYPESFSAGFSLTQFNMSIEYAAYSHSDLGFTHQFGINLKINE